MQCKKYIFLDISLLQWALNVHCLHHWAMIKLVFFHFVILKNLSLRQVDTCCTFLSLWILCSTTYTVRINDYFKRMLLIKSFLLNSWISIGILLPVIRRNKFNNRLTLLSMINCLFASDHGPKSAFSFPKAIARMLGFNTSTLLYENTHKYLMTTEFILNFINVRIRQKTSSNPFQIVVHPTKTIAYEIVAKLFTL